MHGQRGRRRPGAGACTAWSGQFYYEARARFPFAAAGRVLRLPRAKCSIKRSRSGAMRRSSPSCAEASYAKTRAPCSVSGCRPCGGPALVGRAPHQLLLLEAVHHADRAVVLHDEHLGQRARDGEAARVLALHREHRLVLLLGEPDRGRGLSLNARNCRSFSRNTASISNSRLESAIYLPLTRPGVDSLSFARFINTESVNYRSTIYLVLEANAITG